MVPYTRSCVWAEVRVRGAPEEAAPPLPCPSVTREALAAGRPVRPGDVGVNEIPFAGSVAEAEPVGG
jgi:hypothetical protein